MTLPFLKILFKFPLSAGVFFFSLPTQEFFRGQGKIKVGQKRKKWNLIY